MKKSAVFLGAGVLLAGVAATLLWLDLRGERAQGGELAARISALESAQPASSGTTGELPSTSPDSPAAPPAATVPAGATASAASAPGAVPGAPAGVADSAASPAAGILEAMQSAQGREFTRTMMRGMMAQMYPDIAEEMNLSPDEVEALFDLLARQQDDLTADSLAMMTGGVQDAAARQQLQRSVVEKQQAHQRELAAHLGAKHARWEQYQQTAAARQQLGQLESALAASGNPLTEEQSRKLVAAYTTEMKSITEEEEAWSTSPAALESSNLMQESMERALVAQQRLAEVARPHLTAAQREHQQRQLEQQSSMLRAIGGMMGGQGGAAQAPGTMPGTR